MAKQKQNRVEPRAKKPTGGSAPEDVARAAVARAEAAPSGKVIITARLFLTRETAERLTAQAIREQKSFEAVVAEILETAEPD